MARTASSIRYPPALQEALAWLGAAPAADPLRDLAPLRSHLAALAAIDIPPLQRLKILELFQTRAGLTGSAVKPLLLDATLPVPQRLRTVAHGLMHVHEALATGCLKALREVPPDALRRPGRTPQQVCAAGLANLSQLYEIAQFISTPPPPGFWAHAETFYRLAAGEAAPDAVPPAANETAAGMKALLALAAAQPDGFSPREIAFLAAYLQQHAVAVDIRSDAAVAGDDDLWLDAAHAVAPTAMARRRAAPDAALHFSCAALSRVACRHLSQLADGAAPEALGLPREAMSADYRDALARAAAHWDSPRQRRTHRRRHGYRVQVCTHLGQLWQQSGADAGTTEIELTASDWMILNESASGYAIMHVAGALAGLVPGSAIGLRPAADKPWHICVVRWARSENPEHIELGLELLAPRAEAVRIARRTADGEAAPLPALLLPPLAAIKRGEALLTARGLFAPGVFALIHESPGRVQVSECQASHLSMHTACIEIFEFERRRLPD
ncbi:MAG: hypothetical protein PHY45_13530 [Rhodocyclaceae bacterium]|nr:hypothetical protein [Rhodocyclaceae bacterium]